MENFSKLVDNMFAGRFWDTKFTMQAQSGHFVSHSSLCRWCDCTLSQHSFLLSKWEKPATKQSKDSVHGQKWEISAQLIFCCRCMQWNCNIRKFIYDKSKECWEYFTLATRDWRVLWLAKSRPNTARESYFLKILTGFSREMQGLHVYVPALSKDRMFHFQT